MPREIRTGDKVKWNSPIFSGGSFYRGRCRGAKFQGNEVLEGEVVKHSYGSKTGQHTFTILLVDGNKKLVKGRNLYPNIIDHVIDENSVDRRGQ